MAALSTKLSFALAAFTTECDNAFERALLAPTGLDFAAWRASRPPVFLVSLAMWANYLRHLTPALTVRELAALAGEDQSAISGTLNGLRRWRYVVVEPGPEDFRARPARPNQRARLTPAGRRCIALWQPLPATVEARWRKRLGDAPVNELQRRLRELLRAAGEPDWSHCLPIVSSRRELFSVLVPVAGAEPVADRPFFALLAQTLLAYTLEFERESRLPLPVAANVLRVLAPAGLALRDLPMRTGISAPAVAQSLTLLRRHGLAVESTAAAGRSREVRLTAAGEAAQRAAQQRMADIERNWQQRFGAATVTALHNALDAVIGDGDPAKPPLAQALVPAPGLWRTAEPAPKVLPHHPIPLGRGGWLDGA